MESTKTRYKENREQDRGKGKEEAKDGRDTLRESNVGEKRRKKGRKKKVNMRDKSQELETSGI